MSFFFETVQIPFWFIIFIFSSATPLWLKWAKKFHKKFIVTGILQKRFRRAKSAAEIKMDVFNKATDHWKNNSELSGFSDKAEKSSKKTKKSIDPGKKKNVLEVLKILAEAGEAGILPKSISDKLKINTVETNTALEYLVEKQYVEEINSNSGKKYYLTKLGIKYCENKKYIPES